MECSLLSPPLSCDNWSRGDASEKRNKNLFPETEHKSAPFLWDDCNLHIGKFFWMSFRSFSITHFPSGYEIQLTPSSFSNPIPFPGGMEIVLSKPQLGKPQLIMLISFHSHSNSLFLLTVIRAKGANCANRCS